MLAGVWGRKIGMTQYFEENTVVPVTVIGLGYWYVLGHKVKEKDGYDAILVGNLRKRFEGQEFSQDWLKKMQRFFSMIREIKLVGEQQDAYNIGQAINAASLLEVGQQVDARGITKGKGFQGVVKRYNFSGGTASHGPRFGRWPGSISFMRKQGRVIKGKRLPGHMGVDQRVMRNLKIVHIEDSGNIALVKGSMPGHTGSWIYMEKRVKES